MLLDLAQGPDAGGPGPASRTFWSTRAPGRGSITMSPSCRVRPPKPAGANFYPDGRQRRKRSSAGFSRCRRPSAPGRRASSRRFAAAPDRRFSTVPVQPRVSERSRARRAAAARSGRPGDRADAEGLPDEACGRVPVQRLLRQRRGVDGAEGHDRADDRSVRGVRGRVLQLQGGVRVVHHAAGRSREREDPEVQRRAAGHREPPADRPGATQSEARVRWRRWSWSTRSSRPATAIAACRPQPSIFPTTSASPGRRAPSA